MTGISDIFLNGIRPVQDAPSSNVSGDGLSYLSSLKNGDTFTAKVVDVSGSDITLKLPAGGTVNAKLSSEMSISEGQTISFEVKNGDIISIDTANGINIKNGIDNNISITLL